MAEWKQVSKHEFNFGQAIDHYWKALLTFLFGMAALAGGIAILILGTGGNGGITPYIFGGLFVLVGLFCVVGGLVSWPWTTVAWARVYEEGLRWKAGRATFKKRWAEITSTNRTDIQVVTATGQRTALGRTDFIDVNFEDNTRVRFDYSLTNYGKLASEIQVRSAQHQIADSAEELQEDGKTFGPIHLDRKGIEVFGKRYRWREVRSLHVANGELYAHPSCEEWKPIRLSEIPNYLLMLSLVKMLERLRE